MYKPYRCDMIRSGLSTPDRITGNQVLAGHVLEVSHFIGSVDSEEERITEIGYVDSTGNDRTLNKTKPDPFVAVTVKGTVWLSEYERPFIEVTQLNVGNLFYLSVHGKLWPIGKVGVIVAQIQQADNVPDNR